MNGSEAARKIRLSEQESGAHLVIVAMTAYAMKGDRRLCLQAGMDDYIAKPVTHDALRTIAAKYGPRRGAV